MKRHIVVLAATLTGAAFAAAPVREASGNSIEERVDRLERMLESRNQVQVEMQQQLSDLEYEVGQLRGSIELHGHQLEQILARQRDLYQDIERRLGGASQAPEPTAPTTVAPVTPQSTAEVTANVAYEAAFGLLKGKRFDEAATAFSDFIRDYPTSNYVANAYYWQAQLKYRDSNLVDAKQSFLTVVNKYPKSSKRAESIFKLGLIADKQGDAAEAKKRYQQVINEYPSSNVAQLAKGKL
ncbi:tol-pal system protein YbgF [Neiella sp. HB171785]|uniref:Cell division coordinator CpoB n=1 Tax=Neiella litorisoli TaxID=2771431 RepID=A0A8J6QH35_9GAMM|nr:tol-pal system protein YbgF [Neiella litorisoli]MBD1388268.1 tol-pal system protein YbgF [Neiella litorisoli]